MKARNQKIKPADMQESAGVQKIRNLPVSADPYITGRGAQSNPANRFLKLRYSQEDPDGLDRTYKPERPEEPEGLNGPARSERLEQLDSWDAGADSDPRTRFLFDNAKSAISKNDSADLPFDYSVNPYQGCEHGCVYCYARNSHEYWGFSAGLDFERKIMVKRNVVELLEQELNRKNYRVSPIVLSGNTDCYQPIERKLGLTRKILALMLRYRHPVSLITKNSLIVRDLDLLKELAALNLVQVAITINSLDENLRQKMEPRTATARKRLDVIRTLDTAGIPVRLMCAPIIPGLNQAGIPRLIEAAARHGAWGVSYTIVRLNGAIGPIFRDWINKAFPEKAARIMNLIASCHDGKVNDSRWGVRMRGDGRMAETIARMVDLSRRRYMGDQLSPLLRTDLFAPIKGKQLSLF